MPSLTFILPHWLYWSGLILFPLIAMAMVRRESHRTVTRGLSLPLGYLFLVTSGFLGIHRFYLRSWWGFAYPPLGAGSLSANLQRRAFLDAGSQARHDLAGADSMLDLAAKAVAAGEVEAAQKLATAKEALVAAKQKMAALTQNLDQWDTTALVLVIVIAVCLAIDAALLPRLLRRCRASEPPTAAPEVPVVEPQPAGTREDPILSVQRRLAASIDRISGFTGHFVCYWSVIAVFVYYYEVLARYVFNSPTNWAHEGMFLMFGMQYVISGAFAYREDSHVRVDVLYTRLPTRSRAVVDITTSLFFFIFAGAFFWTSWIFMMDSLGVWEVSFTEWAIQYWPVKAAMVVGAVLILLQGLSKLLKDIAILSGSEA